tara:strand:+ start:60 stop:383 length:324 start_codon:yes stop_codon:yes gene_type:complete
MINHLLPDIYKHLENEYPKEGCGLITEDLKWIPMKNIAKENLEFEMEAKEFTIEMLKNKIIGVVHSHPTNDPTPSETDIKQCNGLNLDYFIIGLPDKKLYHLKPQRN